MSDDRGDAPEARIAHVSPGRIRLRTRSAGDEHLEGLQEHLSGMDGVEQVTTDSRTGSVLIHTNAADTDAVLSDIDEIGSVLSLGMASSDVGDLAGRLGNIVGRLNREIYDATGENLHLGIAVPAGMAGLGVWQTVRTGLGVELIPGPLLLWLAWDVYRDHGTIDVRPSS